MSASELLQIASFANAAEADQFRSILEEHGVSAFVDGANANTVLSHVGSALGGVRLLVRASDADRATEIIDSLGDGSDVSDEAWFCGECQEEVDAGFQACWSCGNARVDVQQPFPIAVREEHLVPGDDEDAAVHVETLDTSGYDRSNPYASPLTPAEPARSDEEPTNINPEAEDMLLRAWRASIIGLVFFPVLTHLYSMYLLIRAATLSPHFSPDGRKRFYRAFAVNVIAGCAWGMVINSVFR